MASPRTSCARWNARRRQTFAALRQHFDDAEIVELCFHVALYVGFGRMGMSLDMVDDLPAGYREDGPVTPWRQPEVLELAGWSAPDAAG